MKSGLKPNKTLKNYKGVNMLVIPTINKKTK
jgi:hypothetical protein